MKKSCINLTRTSALSSFFTTVFAVSAYAADVGSDANRLEELLVSANLYETPLFDVMGTATVVDQSDIQRFQPANPGEIFEMQSGLDIVRTGGRASNTSLFTRGTNSSHTLILVNGQRFSSASLGLTQFNFIDPEQIERVEMLRGSRSALYGSDAMGGVLQIFTRRGSEAPEGFFNLEAGSHATRRVATGGSFSLNQFSHSASVSFEESDGIDSLVDDSGTNGDSDGYENANANLFGAYEFIDGYELSYFYWHSESEAEFDSRYANQVYPFSDNLQSAGNVQLDMDINEIYQTLFSVGHSRDEAEIKAYPSEFNSYRNTLYWQHDIRPADEWLFNLGVDYEQTQVSGNTDWDEDEREVLAGFVQAQCVNELFDLQAGSRYDDNSTFGGVSTQSASAAINFSESLRSFISWNEGFRAPTFNDLFYPESGNRDLNPEESSAWEWGMKVNMDLFSLQFSLFKNEIENLIEWAPIDEAGEVWRPQNIADARIRGAELIASAKLADWHVDAGLHYIDTEDGSTARPLANRAKHKLTLDTYRSWQRFSLGLMLKAQTKRYSSYDSYSDSQATLPGHVLVSAYAGWDITEQISMKFKLNNVLDKEYQLSELYNEDGINGSVKLNYSF